MISFINQTSFFFSNCVIYNKQIKAKVSSEKCSNETHAAQEKTKLYLIQTNIVIVKEVDLYVYRT